MNVKELYDKNEEISLESYLNKHGITDYKEYLKPTGKNIEPYYKYENIMYATSELEYWIKLSEHQNVLIHIIQDSDVDGICSTIILYNYIKLLNTKINVKILIHESKERGLDDEKIMDRIKSDKPDLVIVPDAGSNNKDMAHVLSEMGIGLIVLDHHDIDEPIEDGYLVSNQIGDVDKNGSGCLVTHKFLQALDKVFDVHYSQKFIDLVALSIISDSMDVTSMQNREYLYWGLFRTKCAINPFLQRMIDVFLKGKDFDQRDIAFSIVPKLNAITRSKDMSLKQKLLLAFMGRYDYDEMIQLCEKAHKDQISTVEETINKNIENINKDDHVIILANDTIPRSYSGLIAGKLKNICDNKPCIVGSIKDGYMIGSLRSPIPLRETLNNIDLIDFASGHEYACGVGIYEKNISPLIEYLNTIDFDYSQEINVTKSYNVKNVPSSIFNMFEKYGEIFGHGLPKPLFHIKGIKTSTDNIYIMGSNKRTIKIKNDGIDFMIFNCTKEDKENLKLGHYENDCFVSDDKTHKIELEVTGYLSVNKWNGNKNYQVIIEDYEIIDKNDLKLEDIF